MSFQDAMNVMLPPQAGNGTAINPHMTGSFGESRSKGPHGGVDFNYTGGQALPLNQAHPYVFSPVSGEVVYARTN